MGDEQQQPPKGQFCERHFSWLCQAGQGKCQYGEDYELRKPDGVVPALGPEESR